MRWTLETVVKRNLWARSNANLRCKTSILESSRDRSKSSRTRMRCYATKDLELASFHQLSTTTSNSYIIINNIWTSQVMRWMTKEINNKTSTRMKALWEVATSRVKSLRVRWERVSLPINSSKTMRRRWIPHLREWMMRRNLQREKIDRWLTNC